MSVDFIPSASLYRILLLTDSTGTLDSSIKYLPFGDCLESQGEIGTDRLFTGQRLDDTGLYYYGARYYDCTIGRFISADTTVQSPTNPQTLNRYSYCLNNPLKYVDSSGHYVTIGEDELGKVIQVNSKGEVSPNATPPPTKKIVTITSVTIPFTVSFEITDDPFSVHQPGIVNNPGLPIGHGTTTIRGTAIYTDEGITVGVTVLSKDINMPSTVVVTYTATVQVESQNYALKLDPPKSALLPPNSSVASGSRNISGVSLGMQVSLEIVPSAYDKDTSKIKELPNKVVVPYAWVVNLGTGTVSRINYWWSR